MLETFLNFVFEIFSALFSKKLLGFGTGEPLKGSFQWEKVSATVIKIKPASIYKTNGIKKQEGYIHIYQVAGKSRLFKDVSLFPVPKFKIGQTVNGYIKNYNNEVDSQTMGLFFLNI